MRPWYAFVVFFAVMAALTGGLHYYLYARLARAPGIESWQRIGGWVLLAGAILMPIGMVASWWLPCRVSSVVSMATYTWMGLVVLAFFLTAFSEVLRAGAAMLALFRVVPDDPGRRAFFSQLLTGGIGFAAPGLGGYGMLAVRNPEVRPLRLALRRFPAALDGFKLVQLTDIHVGPTIDGAWLRNVVDKVNALEPDLVAITGDLVDGSVEELREHVAPLADLRAKHGVFFVTGNHEYYSGVDAWLAELERLGIRVLRNEHVRVGSGEASFDLAGVDDYKARDFGNGHGADLDKALLGRDATRELVLLAHQPKQAMEAAAKGVGLQLSGHTHGGQIFPWGFFVRLDQRFVAGLDRVGDMLLYTSRGTGYWGPPMRVGAPAEITLLELTRENAA